MKFNKAIVLGGGAFGTSMACVLAENFKEVILKVRSQDIYDSIQSGENAIYLPGQNIPANIIPALSWEELDELVQEDEVELLVNGLPTSAISGFYEKNKPRMTKYLEKGISFVSISKGIDPDTLDLSDDLFLEYFSHYQDQICYLSGPSFAKEIVDKQVTIVSLAGKTPDVLMDVCQKMNTDFFT